MASSISQLWNQTVPFYGYQISLGQAFTTGLTLAAITYYAIKKMTFPFTSKQSMTNTKFWEKIENTSTLAKEDAPVTIGRTTFPSPAHARKQMFLSCNFTADFVKKFLVKSNFKGTVLDLGGGTGANALPLVAKGCKVTLIEKDHDVISTYISNEDQLFAQRYINLQNLQRAQTIEADITTSQYPQNMDAVICFDTLPYIPPSQLRATMNKIFQTLRPGGKFIGTIFFKPDQKTDPLINAMSQLGAHFYPDKAFARQIITRSGFQILQEQVLEEEDCFNANCLEFIAEKPLT